ncbi:unnamed protein product [Haemonchus placei]|uniref:Uncharacterized protein n=1 Tax=Haemonchus placei TaxID=6290 RepID=A0A3P7W2Y7_HAEPC|nr:unnamed protein product [Haemonchus placei]
MILNEATVKYIIVLFVICIFVYPNYNKIVAVLKTCSTNHVIHIDEMVQPFKIVRCDYFQNYC